MNMIVLILAVLLVSALTVFFYVKYRLNNTPDNHNLEAAMDVEVSKVMNNNSTAGMAIGVYKDGQVFFKGYGTIHKEARFEGRITFNHPEKVRVTSFDCGCRILNQNQRGNSHAP